MAKKEPKSQCITVDPSDGVRCTDNVYSRGLCVRCLQRAKQKVTAGQTTWDELVKLGLATTATRKERLSKFSRAFAAAKAKAKNGDRK